MSRLRGRAWWVLAFFAVILVIFGIGDVLVGVTADPAIAVAISGLQPADVEAQDPIGYRLFDFVSRSGGMNLALLGLLFLAIVIVPYRAGQRWAWRTMWLLPVWAALVPIGFLVYGVAPGQPPAPPMISGPIFAAVAALALLADRGRFAEAGGGARASRGAERVAA